MNDVNLDEAELPQRRLTQRQAQNIQYDNWVQIEGLQDTIEIPHVVEVLHSIDCDLAHRAKCMIQFDFKRREYSQSTRICKLQLRNRKETHKFAYFWTGNRKFPKNNQKRIKVKLGVRTPHFFQSDWKERLKTFKWLRITNLPNLTVDKNLRKYIRETSGKDPNFVQVLRHSKPECASMAMVEMRSPEDAQIAMDKCHMTQFGGSTKMWIVRNRGQRKGADTMRFEHFKRYCWKLEINNLPVKWNEHEIRELCSKYGTVLEVINLKNSLGYFLRAAAVTMSTIQQAGKLFDALNGRKVEGRILETRYRGLYGSKQFMDHSIVYKAGPQWRDEQWIKTYEKIFKKVGAMPLNIKPMKGRGRDEPRDEQEQDPTEPRRLHDRMIVTFEKKKDAEKCRKVMKELKTARKDRVSASWIFSTNWIEITRFDRDTTIQQIIDLVKKKTGTTIEGKNIKMQHYGKSSASIRCKSNMQARKFVEKLNLSELNGSRVLVMMRHYNFQGVSTTLLMDNVQRSTKIKDVKAHVVKYAKVSKPPLEIRWKDDIDWLVIEFESLKDAIKAEENLHGTILKGDRIRVWFGAYDDKRRLRKKAIKAEKEEVTEWNMKVEGKLKMTMEELKEMKKEKNVILEKPGRKKVSKLNTKTARNNAESRRNRLKEKEKKKKGGVKKAVKV